MVYMRMEELKHLSSPRRSAFHWQSLPSIISFASTARTLRNRTANSLPRCRIGSVLGAVLAGPRKNPDRELSD